MGAPSGQQGSGIARGSENLCWTENHVAQSDKTPREVFMVGRMAEETVEAEGDERSEYPGENSEGVE